MPRKYILPIDGGGLRGIIPAIALAKLERVTGRPARETFSFAAGTSTGAIIVAALAAGVPASRVLKIYTKRARQIFTGYPPLNTLRCVVTGSMYSTRRLHALISPEMTSANGWSLNDSPIYLLITAKGVPDGRPWYFVRDNPKNSGCTGYLGIVDCATAAPTYFQPWRIQDITERPPHCDPTATLVDGSVGVAGNPVYQACVEAFHYSDGYIPEETTVISLGTGRSLSRRQYGWIGGWLQWTLDEMLESPGEQQTELVWRHFPQTAFYRIDVELEQDINLDDMRRVDHLREYGESLADAIDWRAILSGTDKKFRVRSDQKRFSQYAQQNARRLS